MNLSTRSRGEGEKSKSKSVDNGDSKQLKESLTEISVF